MAATDQIFSRLRRTLLSIFRIGNIQIKDNTGIVETRNADDTAYSDIHVNQIRIGGDNASNAVILDAPAALGSSPVFVLPNADGSTGQVLSTDGAGNLSFADVSSNANLVQKESFTEATSSPLTIFTPPANADIMEISVLLSAAAAASGASIEIGTSGDPDLYFTATDIDMQTTGTYTVKPLANVTGSPSSVQLAITVGAQTFTGQVFVTYSNPS